jgi:hypothetical protein
MRIRQTDVDPGVPSFTLVASDALITPAIRTYIETCNAFGLDKQASEVNRALMEIMSWQDRNSNDTHLPSHQHRNLDPPPGYFALLKAFVEWFEEHDGIADDWGELVIVKHARYFLEKWNEETKQSIRAT